MADCPTPRKAVFLSRGEAKVAVRSRKRPGMKGQLRPYLCPCGCWHLTSMPRRTARQFLKSRRLAA